MMGSRSSSDFSKSDARPSGAKHELEEGPDPRQDQRQLAPKHDELPRQVKLHYGFINSLTICTWIVHFLAVGATIAGCVINIQGWYWADVNSRHSGLFSVFNMNQSRDALQFAAKLHEILIVASLTSIALHVARRMLVGEGLPLGLLTGVYQFGTVSWLFSWAFFRPLMVPGRPRNCVFALALGFGVIYAAIVGPAAAIVILPSLDWWKLDNPYGDNAGGDLATFMLTLNSSTMYPKQLTDASHDDWSGCTGSLMVSTCPNAGANAIFDSLDQATLQGVMPSIFYTSSSTGLLRKLQSTAEFAQLDETFTSVAATLPYSVPDLAGCFASYVRDNPKAGVAGTVQQPRLRPRQDVFAPLVQVQCSPFLYSSLDNDTLEEQTRYNAKGLRNLDKIDEKGVAESYDGEWSVRPDIYDFVKDRLNRSSFEWWNIDDEASPLKLGAVAAIPYLPDWNVGQGFTGLNKSFSQDSLIIPCSIDAYWAEVDVVFEPGHSDTLDYSFNNLSTLAPLWDKPSNASLPKHFRADRIHLDASWASKLGEAFDRPDNKRGSGRLQDLDGLIDTLALNLTQETGEELSHFISPIGGFGLDAASNIAGFTASLLSTMLADGISRQSQSQLLLARTGVYDNGTVLLEELRLETATVKSDLYDLLNTYYNGKVLVDQETLDMATRLDWEMERYGWGYSLRPATTKFGIAVLLIHAAILVAYIIYGLFYRLARHGWFSNAWGELPQLIATAILSKPRDEETVHLIASERGRHSADARARLRTFDEDSLELVVGHVQDEGGRVEIGKQY